MVEALHIRDVHYTYPGGPEALKGVTLSLKPGETAALLGYNGSGKTTLLLVAAGLLKPQQGEVLVAGINVSRNPANARRHIGLLFQDPDDQLFNPTVFDEIAFAPRLLGVEGDELHALVEEYAGLVGAKHLLNRPVHTLSLGEKKRVALASILVYKPSLLLLDEPLAGLDPPGAASLLALLCRLHRQGTSILLSTQNIWLAEALAEKAHIIEDGKIVWSGPPRGPEWEKTLEERKLYPPKLFSGCGSPG